MITTAIGVAPESQEYSSSRPCPRSCLGHVSVEVLLQVLGHKEPVEHGHEFLSAAASRSVVTSGPSSATLAVSTRQPTRSPPRAKHASDDHDAGCILQR